MMTVRIGDCKGLDVEVEIEDGVFVLMQSGGSASYREWDELSEDDKESFSTLMSTIDAATRRVVSQQNRTVD